MQSKAVKSQKASGVILSYIQLGIQLAMSLVTTPVILKLLGQSEYGLYNLTVSLVANLSVLSLGFGSAYVRFYIKAEKEDPESIPNLCGMFFAVHCIIALVSLVIGAFIITNVQLVFGNKITLEQVATARKLVCFMVFNTSLSFPMSIFTSVMSVHERFVIQKVLRIIELFARPTLSIVVLWMGLGSVGMIASATVILLFLDAIRVIYCFKKLKFKMSFKKMNFGIMKEIGIFSFFVFLSQIVDELNWNIDKMIIGWQKGTVEVAIYAVGLNIATYMSTIVNNIHSVFVPQVNRLVMGGASKKDLTQNMIKIGRLQAMVLIPLYVGFIFWGLPFVNLWAGKDYSNAYIVTLILAGAFLLPSLQRIGVSILQAENNHKFRSILIFGFSILNVFVSIPLCSRFGAIGSAMGTFISMTVGNLIIMNIYYQKKEHLDMVAFWKSIIPIIVPIIPTVLYAAVIHRFVNLSNISYFLITIIGFLIVYGVFVWLCYMNKEEKKYIRNILKKSFRKAGSN